MSDEDRAAIGKRTRANFEKHFQWHMSGKKWEGIFDNLPLRPLEQTWCSQPRIAQPDPKPEEEKTRSASSVDLARFLINNVLKEPSKLNSYFESRLTRDLIYKSAVNSTGGMYFNEYIHKDEKE